MSVMYCDKHDTFTDLDWHSEGCPECEREDIEREESEHARRRDDPLRLAEWRTILSLNSRNT